MAILFHFLPLGRPRPHRRRPLLPLRLVGSRQADLRPCLFQSPHPRMSEDDRSYFYRRAEEEIERARASVNERLVHFHYLLAGLYLDRIYGHEGDPRRDSAVGG